MLIERGHPVFTHASAVHTRTVFSMEVYTAACPSVYDRSSFAVTVNRKLVFWTPARDLGSSTKRDVRCRNKSNFVRQRSKVSLPPGKRKQFLFAFVSLAQRATTIVCVRVVPDSTRLTSFYAFCPKKKK